MHRIFVTRVACCFGLLLFAGPRASAQGNPPGTNTISASVTGVQQFEAALDEGGEASWSRAAIGAGLTRQFVPAFAAGVSLRHASERWHMNSPAAFGGTPPWRDLRRNSVGLNLSLALSRTLLVGLAPTVEWASDAGANLDDALTYGAAVSVVKVFNPDLTLGAGVSVNRQFYSVKKSPFAIVNWKLNDRLRIANALSAGPVGGSGIELRCTLSPEWELAAGGVVRSDRYRLASGGAYSGQVGETSSLPMFARLSRKLGPMFKLDLYAGGLAKGRLRIKDSEGRDLASTEYPFAPAIAATVSFRR